MNYLFIYYNKMNIQIKYRNSDNLISLNVDSFNDIKNKENIIYLDCHDNNLITLKRIENLTKLQKLNCYCNKLTSLNCIENLTELQELYCHNN